MQSFGLKDIPVEKVNDESLGLTPYVESLCEFVLKCETPMTIAIQGDWGSGKTSMLNMIREKIDDETITVWFNTWQYSQFDMQDDLPVSMLTQFVKAIGGDNEKKLGDSIRSFAKKGLGTFVKTVATVGAGGLGGELAQKGVEKLIDGMSPGDLDQSEQIKVMRQEISRTVDEKIKGKANGKIVVFVDDLDRLPPEKAVELLEVLKNFLDISGCVFILAVDYGVVVTGVAKKYGGNFDKQKGRSFFDKIIQLPFNMPISHYDASQYCETLLKKLGVEYSDQDISNYIDLATYSVGFNPRGLKRIFNLLLLLNITAKKQNILIESHGAKIGEKQRTIFAILCLQSAFDTVYEFLLKNLSNLDNNIFKDLSNVETLLSNPKYVPIFKEEEDKENLAQRISLFMETFYQSIQHSSDADLDNLSANEIEVLKRILSFSAITSTEETKIRKTNPRYNIEELKKFDVGFVGVQYGINGLTKMDASDLKSYKFQYTGDNMKGKRNWIEIQEFNNAVDAKLKKL
jgi:hypothetical protein